MAIDALLRDRAMGLLGEFARLEGEQKASYWDRVLPHEADEQSELAQAFDRLGVELYNDGDAEGALNAFWPNFALRLRLVSQRTEDRGAIRDFASAADLLAQASLAVGNIDVAETMFAEALKYRHGLCDDDPTDAHAAYLYGVALNHMGRLEHAKGNAASERAYLIEAHAHLVNVDKAWPGSSFIEEELADVTQELAKFG